MCLALFLVPGLFGISKICMSMTAPNQGSVTYSSRPENINKSAHRIKQQEHLRLFLSQSEELQVALCGLTMWKLNFENFAPRGIPNVSMPKYEVYKNSQAPHISHRSELLKHI